MPTADLNEPTGAPPEAPSPVTGSPWWKEAVFYQIYPRSFADSDGDGIGDLAGIRAHLPDLAWLGVDALWLSPFYRSPMVDFGYDVSDYCDVDPTFGTLDDFDRLIEDAHSLGLQVIIDWVPNHTSDQHPWFIDARSGAGSRHRNWYVWRDARPDGAPPNNWVAAFDLSAPTWTFDEPSGQWYLHLFDTGQPDLNWDEPDVVRAMHHVLRFWLDRGVDGFRADVIHCIGKDPELPDDPPPVAGIPHSALNDVPVTHERLRDIRRVIDSYPGDRLMVGEVYLLSTAAIATYYGDGDELQLAFNFPPLYAAAGRRTGGERASSRPSRRWMQEMPGPAGCSPTTTTPAIAPATTGPRPAGARTGPPPSAGARPGRGRPRCCSSPFGAHHSSTRARSSDCSTPSSRPTAESTRADGTAAGPRSRGTGPASTAGRSPVAMAMAVAVAVAVVPGSRSRPTRRGGTTTTSIGTTRPSCISTGA